jgi:mono/diheme cytochrome c family protein
MTLPKKFSLFLKCALCAVLVACEKQPPADVTDPGQLLFLGYTNDEVNCSRCHGPDGQGGTEAPELYKIFTKYNDEKVGEIILEGKGLGKDSMPAFDEKLTPQQVESLMKFLKIAFPPE